MIRRTTKAISTQKAMASAIVRTTSTPEPATATAVASAIRNHAEMSSIAALASASTPIGRLSIRRSTRMRASTGKAVIDIDTPMKSANAVKARSGPTSS